MQLLLYTLVIASICWVMGFLSCKVLLERKGDDGSLIIPITLLGVILGGGFIWLLLVCGAFSSFWPVTAP